MYYTQPKKADIDHLRTVIIFALLFICLETIYSYTFESLRKTVYSKHILFLSHIMWFVFEVAVLGYFYYYLIKIKGVKIKSWIIICSLFPFLIRLVFGILHSIFILYFMDLVSDIYGTHIFVEYYMEFFIVFSIAPRVLVDAGMTLMAVALMKNNLEGKLCQLLRGFVIAVFVRVLFLLIFQAVSFYVSVDMLEMVRPVLLASYYSPYVLLILIFVEEIRQLNQERKNSLQLPDSNF